MKRITIDWLELFKGLDLDYLLKDQYAMNTSPAVLYWNRDKIKKELNKRINRQIKRELEG